MLRRDMAAFLVMGICLLAVPPSAALDPDPADEEWLPVPFRVRDMTFPTILVMSFMPRPADPIGAGNWGFEANYSASNSFQMSQNVEEYLAGRGGERRPLDGIDAEEIARLSGGDRFYFDGEFGLFELGVHYGVSDRLSLSMRVGYLTQGGGYLDGTIYDFHDSFGLGQSGRDFVVPGSFQLLYFDGEEDFVLLEPAASGGLTDPVFTLHYFFPEPWLGWDFAVEGGFKPPLARSERFLSSGSVDFGLQLSAQRRWRRQAVVLNLSVIFPGMFEQSESFRPPTLPSLDVAYLCRISSRVTAVAQFLFADNIWREATESALSDPEFQLTLGVQVQAWGGFVGLGLTENLFNFDNTPDLGVHLSFGYLLDSK